MNTIFHKSVRQISVLLTALVLIFSISSCSSTRSTSNSRTFSKRKYTSGFFVAKRGIYKVTTPESPQQKNTELSEFEVETKENPTVHLQNTSIETSDLLQKHASSEAFSNQKEEIELSTTSILTDITNTFEVESDINETASTSTTTVSHASQRIIQNAKESQRKSYSGSDLSSWELFLLVLGLALLFGVLALIVVEGTFIYSLFLFLAYISITMAGVLLFFMPLMLLLEEAF